MRSMRLEADSGTNSEFGLGMRKTTKKISLIWPVAGLTSCKQSDIQMHKP